MHAAHYRTLSKLILSLVDCMVFCPQERIAASKTIEGTECKINHCMELRCNSENQRPLLFVRSHHDNDVCVFRFTPVNSPMGISSFQSGVLSHSCSRSCFSPIWSQIGRANMTTRFTSCSPQGTHTHQHK